MPMYLHIKVILYVLTYMLVVQIWFKLYFSPFQAHYHSLPCPISTKENKVQTNNKTEPQIFYSVANFFSFPF